MTKKILISAGEASGDIHAANLVRNLKSLRSDIEFFGIGGGLMQKEGVNIIERMDNLSIIGVWEALVNLGKVRLIYKKLLAKAKEMKPDLAVLIDYPGFNLGVARALKKMGVAVFYYITPQVWVWGEFRIHVIKKYVDRALVIFKFEETLFRKYGINATFVGHPILDREKKPCPDKKSLGIEEKKTVIALLPGSRESEVARILPVMLETASLIRKEKDVSFVLLKTSSVNEEVYDKAMAGSNLAVTVIKDNTEGCLSVSDFVFTASGTATLESAIAGKPMLITYKTSFLTFLLARLFVKTPKMGRYRMVGLANIVAGKRIAPELLQHNAVPKRLAKEILRALSSGKKLEEEKAQLRKVKDSLGGPGASLRAAVIINDFLKQ